MLDRMVRRTCVLAAALLWAVLVPDPAAGQELGAIRVERLPASLAGTWEFALEDPPGGIADLDASRFARSPFPGPGRTGFRRPRDGLVPGLDRPRPSLSIVPLAFVCSQIRDVDEVYLDGQPIGRTGGFPPGYDKGTVVERIYELPPSRSSVPGRHVLAVRVHNAGPREGGSPGRRSSTPCRPRSTDA
jgi:hypothetical protein